MCSGYFGQLLPIRELRTMFLQHRISLPFMRKQLHIVGCSPWLTHAYIAFFRRFLQVSCCFAFSLMFRGTPSQTAVLKNGASTRGCMGVSIIYCLSRLYQKGGARKSKKHDEI